MNLQDIESVKALAEGSPEERAHLEPFPVRRASIETLRTAIALLELAHLQAYLEGKMHCDSYHEGKRSFKDLGESYGYINSFVRQDGGSNTFRFAYRRPAGAGHVIKENIRPTQKGYTENCFKRAADDYEKELALMTEEHYARLRQSSRIVRSAIRKLKGHPVLEHIDWQVE
ncbi:hypothetical protein KCM76_21785 [Zooshikella marina]|uniref:conjugative transfer protein MobI(A/C) n=1 Tax=Zooshikella ganghwensis TaxID=202772 RepID=UPI001BAE84DA|nr:conjugative transfer protein MobI(A/C) [Zooshikella ganghwensis]MBU2708639.1 hypothetical protein [Zooshikella ganghwensis]